MRRLYYSIKALTPLHVGVGTGLGHIDLPIQREVHTGFPMIPGSAVKGALREYRLRKIAGEIPIDDLDKCLSECSSECESKNGVKVKIESLEQLIRYFGCQEQAGYLAFSDLRILLFPVKSLNGIFAYVTSPQVLERLAEDLDLDKMPKIEIDKDKAIVTKTSVNKVEKLNVVVLEEFTFNTNDNDMEPALVGWIGKAFETLGIAGEMFDKLKERLIILHNDAFNDFVQNYTEVQTHVKINPSTGTVQPGALWTEEYLPAETYMYGIIFETRNDDGEDLIGDSKLLPTHLHLGGDITTGKGFVRIYKKEE